MRSTFLAIFALLPVLAASSLASHQRKLGATPVVNIEAKTNLVELQKIPAPSSTVTHKKEAGNGYKPGSPLYNLQEDKKKGDTKKQAEPQSRNETVHECADRAMAPMEGQLTADEAQQGVLERVNKCLDKHNATPMEAWAIRQKAWQVMQKNHMWTGIVSAVVMFIIVLLVAFMYQRNKKDPTPSRSGMAMNRDDFHWGCCSCMEEPTMSLFTCCCFAIRWADTMRMASFLGFWVGVVMILFLILINGLTGGLTGCILWAIVVFYRQKLRREFGLEHSTAKTVAFDCCGYCWFPCCMAVQEARQLEEAFAVGHPIRKVPAGAQRGGPVYY